MFSYIKKNNAVNLRQLITKPVHEWRDHIFNDFEIPVCKLYPEIQSVKNELYASGALYASMSGSGSSIYGIFAKDAGEKLRFPVHYFYKWV